MCTTPEPSDSTLLLVTGTGRSGTSTVAGSLSRLGFAVPQPEVPADETNPRGFYEPQWVVDFHKQIFDEIRIRTNDARPAAVRLAAEASTRPDLVEQLTEWLLPQTAQPRVVIKDPRTFWMHDLWRTAAKAAGMEVAFLTMLRPPVEVARSRDQHYLSERDEDIRRARETTNVAAWCHGILVTERITRGDRRTFVFYHDLMEDWRNALGCADADLGTGAMADIDAAHHPIDDFIDPKLNRSQGTWDDLAVAPEVTLIADAIWEAVSRLVENPDDVQAMGDLDELHARYDRLYTLANDLTLDQTNIERENHRRELRKARQNNKALRKRNNQLAAELENSRKSLTNRVIARLRRR